MSKMRHNCETHGCRMDQRTDPAILDGLLPRGASFGDMDGWAEINGHFLFVEFKSPGAPIPMGQKMALERLSRLPKCSVLVVFADENLVSGYQWILNGKWKSEMTADVDQVRNLVRVWGSGQWPALGELVGSVG